MAGRVTKNMVCVHSSLPGWHPRGIEPQNVLCGSYNAGMWILLCAWPIVSVGPRHAAPTQRTEDKRNKLKNEKKYKL